MPLAGHVDPADAVQVQVTALSPTGSASLTVAPATAEGPLFVTPSVYVVRPPCTTLVTPLVFVMARSDSWTSGVTVGSLGAGVSGSSVSTVNGVTPTLPVTCPWVDTDGTPGGKGELIVASNVMVVLLPGGSVGMSTLTG